MVALNALPEASGAHGFAGGALDRRGAGRGTALRQYDDKLFPPTADPAVLDPAKELHAAWARWADEAEALYERSPPAARRPPVCERRPGP